MIAVKRTICALLTTALLISMIPSAVFAADDDPAAPVVEVETTVAATEAAAAPTGTTEAGEPETEATTSPTAETTAPTETVALPPEETTEATEETDSTQSTEETEPTETTEETIPVTEGLLNPASDFPEAPEDSTVTIWEQKDYGYDLTEISREDYLSKYDTVPYGALQLSDDCIRGVQPGGMLAHPMGDASTLATPVLPTPSKVTWSRDIYGEILVTLPKAQDLSRVRVHVTIYRNNSFYHAGSWWLQEQAQAGVPFTLDFVPEINDSGTYYCTVQLVYPDDTAGASGLCTSDTFVYNRPSAKLSTPTGLWWDNSSGMSIANWNPVSNAAGYYVYWNSQYGNVTGTWFYRSGTDCSIPTENSGLTKFQVRALADLKYYQHSDVSNWSDSTISDGKLLTRSNSFLYSSAVSKTTESATYYYDESWFNESSIDNYNHELATMSLCMAMAAYGSNRSDRAYNIKNLFEQLGFSYTDQSVQYGAPTADSIGYAIGSKYVPGADGTPYMLVAVAIRGGGYRDEWASNFTIGNENEHIGFAHAANTVLEGLRKYLAQTGYDGKTKVWITGYSRAAATANIAAQKINTSINQYPGLSTDGLFAYCFECPRTVLTTSPVYQTDYQNVYSIVNDLDIVTKVAMEKWKYNRYGKTYYLPSPRQSSNFTNAISKCKSSYKKILEQVLNTSLNPKKKAEELTDCIKDQVKFTDETADALATYFGSPSNYTYHHQGEVRSKILKAYANNADEDEALTAAIKDILGLAFVGQNPGLTVKFGLNAKTILNAHKAELCLAWMKTLTGKEEFVSAKTRKLLVNCPVDVSVYDSSGTLVARIVNGEPQEVSGSYIQAYVDMNGQKVIWLPTDGEYSVQINATNDGEMSYQIQDVDMDAGSATHLVSYHDVPITQGDTLTAEVQNLESASADYSLQDTQGNPIEADLELSGTIPEYTVSTEVEGSGSVQGGGRFIIGEFSQLTAIPEPQNVFYGWYEGDELVSQEETIRFRVESHRNLKAVFLSTNVTMKLDREYLALKYEPDNLVTADLALSVTPQKWAEFVEWSVEPEDADGSVISVDENGTVTVRGTGMAYAVAKTSFKGYTFTARCRFDITDKDIAPQIQERFGVNGVQLGAGSITTELYSTDYSTFEVLLLLPQNATTASVEDTVPVNNGIAISGARFTDPAVAALFELVVKDDRTLLVVPTQTALAANKIAGSYSSTVTVEVDNTEFVTGSALKLTVKTTLPKLTADAVTLNPFYSGDARQLSIRGGEITGVCIDPDSESKRPAWLELDALSVKLAENAPKTGSAKLQLLADVKGWAKPVKLSVSIKLKNSVPSLKLSAARISLQDDFSSSKGLKLSILPGNSRQTLDDLHVQDIEAPSGYRIEAFNNSDGSFLLIPEAKPAAGKIQLKAHIQNAAETIPLNLTVKVETVKVTLGKSSVSLGCRAPYAVSIPLTVAPADYDMREPVVRIVDAHGNQYSAADFNDLSITYKNGLLNIATTEEAWNYKDVSYKLWISAFEGGKETALTVKILSYGKSAISSSVKASGCLDLSFPGSAITITPSYKNYSLTGVEEFGYSITAKNGKLDLGDQTDLFQVSMSNDGTITVSEKTPGTLNAKYAYSFSLVTMTSNLVQTRTPAIRLMVKQTPVQLKLSKRSVTINPTVVDPAVVSAVLSHSTFNLENPVIRVMDKTGKNPVEDALIATLANGTLTISPGENMQPGQTYKIVLQAAEGQPSSTLTVSILADTKSAVTSRLSVSGSLDVIRPGTGIRIAAPTFTGYNGVGEYQVEHRVIAFRGRTELGDYTDYFILNEEDDHVFTVKNGGSVDHKLTYRLRSTVRIPKPDETFTEVVLPDVALKVTMGKAAMTTDVKAVQLYAKDKHSTGVVTIKTHDTTLNRIRSVTLKDAGVAEGYVLKDFGGGQYAIAFAPGKVALAQNGTVSLQVFLEGNNSTVPNTTVSVKVSVLK